MAGTDLTKTRQVAQRFWAKVQKSDGCWLWTGYVDVLGYGIFRFQGGPKKAHRVAWILSNGPIPAGKHCLHGCDVRRCVNVHHLFLGSHQENMADRDAKGRQWDRRGEKHPSAKLTQSDVIAIRASKGVPLRVLAEQHGVSLACVDAIRCRHTWKHV